MKMSAKSNKIEFNEEFMVMWKEEQQPEDFCKKGILRKKFRKIRRKTPVPKSLF